MAEAFQLRPDALLRRRVPYSKWPAPAITSQSLPNIRIKESAANSSTPTMRHGETAPAGFQEVRRWSPRHADDEAVSAEVRKVAPPGKAEVTLQRK